MNQFVPDWSSNMGDAFAPLGGEDDGLMELLWCKGHVVMQSQAPRKPAPAAMQEHEAAPWFQYPVDDGSLESDLFSEIFGDLPADAGRACKEEEEEEEEEVVVERGAAVTALQSGLMPGPAHAPWEKAGFWPDVGDAARGPSVGEGAAAATEAGESSSVVTVGSRSVCGSNHVQTPGAARARDTAGDSAPPPPMTRNGTVTSLPMRSKPSGAASRGGGGKRKQRDAMEQPESTSLQDVESESGAVTCDEPPQKLTTARRRRAAEVHNLSERRRRDRINEKMKALQELIPHCNKTDKASMLDEAIEYLKSLQLQLQKMWMGGGGGMETAAAAAAAPRPAPVMFPAGVHQYMQRMAASMPRMPPPFMPAAQGSPVSHLPAAVGSMAVDAYARCLAVEHLQPPPSPMHYLQGMGFYQLGAAMNLQQSPPSPAVPAASLPAATARTLPPDNALHKNYCVKL